MNPLVSIYIPTRNRLELLKNAVASVLNQSYSNIELIVVDDCSSDETEIYMKSIIECDNRVLYIRNDKPMGANHARNLALYRASGKYITGLDDDDEFTQDRILFLVNNFNDKYAFICTNAYVFTKKRTSILYNDTSSFSIIRLQDNLIRNVCSNQVFTTRERFLAINGFDENLIALQDWDMWVRMLSVFGDAIRYNEPMLKINEFHKYPRITSVYHKKEAKEAFFLKHKSIMGLDSIYNWEMRINISKNVFYLKGIPYRWFFSQPIKFILLRSILSAFVCGKYFLLRIARL